MILFVQLGTEPFYGHSTTVAGNNSIAIAVHMYIRKVIHIIDKEEKPS